MESELRHLQYQLERMRDDRDKEYSRAERLESELRAAKARIKELEGRVGRAYDAYITNPERGD